MVEPPFGALLISTVGASPLMEPCLLTANQAAIALTAITAGTDKEKGAALGEQTNPWSQNYFARSRDASSLSTLDNGQGSMSG
jgi:hypothetical protein